VLVIPAHVLTVAADASASSQPDGVLQDLKTLFMERERSNGPNDPNDPNEF
jgi:hypothetical protein